MKYIVAIDQGTSSTRCLIFDHNGNIISSAQKEHKQIYPQPGWVEHDPVEIIENTKAVIRDSVNYSGLSKNDIAAVGIANQRETSVIWNRDTGKPYCNALVWQDTRTDKICDKLIKNNLDSKFKEINGLPVATYFSGPKIKWLLENSPQILDDLDKGVVCFGNIDSWLIWNLTGGPGKGKHVTDVTNASRTMLFNLNELDWDKSLLDILGIPKNILPDILPSSTSFGQMQEILPGIPISGVLGDQQAALFGQICFEPGDAKNTYGTGCFLLLNTGEKIIYSEHGLLTTVGYQLGSDSPVFCLEGSIANTGALVQWLRDNIGVISSSSEIEDLANTVEDNGDVYFVPAFSGLYAPYWESTARGLIMGLTRYANKGHIARAALEATAYQTYDVLDAMQKDAKIDLKHLKVDGGMVKNELLMQFQSDILSKSVVRPTITETTALGAAYAAGLHVGYWNSISDLISNWQPEKTWTPNMRSSDRIQHLRKWNDAIKRTYNWVNN